MDTQLLNNAIKTLPSGSLLLEENNQEKIIFNAMKLPAGGK